MSYRPLARAEYVEAIDRYEAQQPGLGARFEAQVESVLAAIAGQPDRYPIADQATREAPVPGFPYCVYYRELPGRVVVVAVYHQSRDPAGWQSRK